MIHFRSIRAPASLKPFVGFTILEESEPFPEHPCSGLIEAIEAARSLFALPTFPEHPCSGLIEAP